MNITLPEPALLFSARPSLDETRTMSHLPPVSILTLSYVQTSAEASTSIFGIWGGYTQSYRRRVAMR